MEDGHIRFCRRALSHQTLFSSLDEFPKGRSPADCSADLSDPWERPAAALSLLRLRANAQFTSWMAVDFLRLHSRSAGRSHVVPGSQVVRGVVSCHCRVWVGGLC